MEGLVFLDYISFKTFKFLRIGHGICSFQCLFDRQDEGIQLGTPRFQGRQVALQRRLTVEVRPPQQGADLGKGEVQRPIKQDLLEPVHLRRAVKPVSRLRDPARLQQALGVVPAQGAGGDARQIRKLLDGVFHLISS